MNKSPNNVPPGAIFICGHDTTTNGMPNEHFAEVEARLKQKGYLVFNPQGIADTRQRVACMVLCDRVVTLPDWDRWENSQKEVHVARALGLDVIFAASFERWEERQKDLPSLKNRAA